MKSSPFNKSHFDVIVLGAGAAGLGAAEAFSSRGLKTALIAPSGIRGAASPRAAGILDPLLEQNQKSPLIPAAVEAFRLFPAFLRKLKRATGSDALYRRTGMIYLAVSEAERKELLKRYQWQKKWMPSLKLLPKEEVFRRFPQAHPETRCGLYYPDVGKINAPEFVKIFKKYLKGKRVCFFSGKTRPSVVRRERGSLEVRFAGRLLTAPIVVNAAGAWARQKSLLGFNVPVEPVRGQMLVLKGSKTAPVIFHSLTGGYLVPWERGVHLAGSTVEYAGFRDCVTEAGKRTILKNVARVCPEVLKMKQRSSWAGLRPRGDAGMPLLGPVPGQAGVYAATGYFRSGILLCVFLGELLADYVLEGRLSPLMKPFLPGRSAAKGL